MINKNCNENIWRARKLQNVYAQFAVGLINVNSVHQHIKTIRVELYSVQGCHKDQNMNFVCGKS